MTAYLATPKLDSLAGGGVSLVSLADPAASCAASPAAAADQGSALDARTPFYDHLMSMIDETALENRRVQQQHVSNAAPLPATPKWRLGQLLTGAAGLAVVLAVGGAVIEAGMRARQPTAVAADAAPQKNSLAIASATAVEVPVARSLPKPQPDSGSIDSKGKAEGGIQTGSVAVTQPDKPPVPAAVPSGEKLDSGGELGKEISKESAKAIPKETGGDGPTGELVSTKASNADVVAPAEEPPSEKAPADAPAPASKAESAPLRIARIVSDANMRAGPGKGQPVVAALPRGTAVEVITCRHWCEVISGAQRGWVYKHFVGASGLALER